jgi:two-component system, sensor histidine kinase LadS
MIRFLALTEAHYFSKACQCMRSGLGWVLIVFFALSASASRADHAQSLIIHEQDQPFLTGSAHFWHEKPNKTRIEQASVPAFAPNFMPLQDETMFNLQPQDRLWIRLDLDRQALEKAHWMLWLPLPLLDVVTLHQSGADGKWVSSRAGDKVSVAHWPEPGRYPRFHLELPPGKTSLYLEIQGSTPLSIPLHIGNEVLAQQADRTGFLGMGLIVGVLLTLVLMCFVTAYTYNDKLYLLYGFYMLVMILAVGAYTGLSAYLLWDKSPKWADAAQGALALLTAGGALYFIEAMLGARQFARRLSLALLTMGALALPLAIIYVFVPRSVGVVILGVYMLMVSFTGLTLASRAWRRGDQVGKWIFFAYLPLALAVLLALARAYGWVVVSWVVQYGVVVALLIEAPMMMVALHARSRQRHEINTREQALNTQDALTGLLTEHIFDDRIRQTLRRSAKRKEDAGIVLISLVNYDSIAAAYGLPVAEQSVLRAVIKLRKVLRDADTVARVGTSKFGLILEGVSHRSRVTDIGARLIAQGLMPLPGLVPEVTLQFHLVAVLMREMPADGNDVKQDLLALLATMSRRTRRPIRFLEAMTTGGTPLVAIPTAPTPVDQLAAQVQSHAPAPRADKPIAQDVESSGSSWDTKSPSSMGATTLVEPRSGF